MQLLLLIRNCLLGSLAGSGIGLGLLTANGQTLAMALAAITADLLQSLDIKSCLPSEVTLDGKRLLNCVADSLYFIIGQILDTGVRIHISRREHRI